ncbi:MAG: FtsL-like putative cell division protein [Bacteroidales bacterium]|jgi:hypothetical protein|nr:FtsL-like putative cell division protein [Bacteroidales bacterium]
MTKGTGTSGKAGKTRQSKTGSYLRELLSGSMVSDRILFRNFGFILFLTLVTAVYIGNRFHAEKITRELARLGREVRDLRAESLATSAELIQLSRQSEVFRLVKEKGLGLEELKVPPYKLVVE